MNVAKIILENGEERIVNCIFYLYNYKYYFLYTENEFDLNGYVKCYFVKVERKIKKNKKGEDEFGDIIGVNTLTEEEWKDILSSINKIIINKKTNVPDDDIQYLPLNLLVNFRIVSKRLFLLLGSVLETAFNIDLNKKIELTDQNIEINSENKKTIEKSTKPKEDNKILKPAEKEKYEKELKEQFEKIRNIETDCSGINYFIDTIEKYMNYNNLSNKNYPIIVLGTNIPEEIIYASKNTPCWIIGGNLTTINWSESFVPRDADSISRSLLGVILNENFDIAKKSLIIVPLINDSLKKISYLLKEHGYKVLPFYFPAVQNENSISDWNDKIERCINEIGKHTKKYISKKNLEESYNKVKKTKLQIQKFLNLANNKKMLAIHRMIVLYSYYCIENIDEWTNKLENLNAELEQKNYNKKNKGNVIVIGSPMYFPNFKIPFLLNEIGLNITEVFDYSTQKFNIPLGKNFEDYINNCLFYDISSANVYNNILYLNLEEKLKRNKGEIEGVVYHIIKGQIDFDFELDRFERLFSKYEIPVFRLETDYHYQDIEQLRIRMEAFAEVIEQKRYSRENNK